MTSYHRRELVPRVVAALRANHAVAVSGVRGVGKTTMVRHAPGLTKGRKYYALDEIRVLGRAQLHPYHLLDEVTTIDEVYRMPQFFSTIRDSLVFDRKMGQFLLTGSANLPLLENVAEALAGRAAYYRLRPMARRERRGRTSKPPFLTSFLAQPQLPAGPASPLTESEARVGGLPPVCLGPQTDVDAWFREYIERFFEREARILSRATVSNDFRNFTRLAAQHTGQVLNIAQLAREAGVNPMTAGRYLDLLDANCVVERVPAFRKSRASRLVKSPKLYWADSALAAHMAVYSFREGPPESLPEAAALIGTYIYQNLAAILEAHHPDAGLTFWEEQGRHAVDFVIEVGGRVIAIDLKFTDGWDDADLSDLRAFFDRTPACEAAVLAHNGTESVQLADRLYAIPIGHLVG